MTPRPLPFVASIVVLLVLVPSITMGQTPSSTPVATVSAHEPSSVSASDSLFLAMDPGGALELLELRLETAPDDFEALWRSARVSLVIGIMSPDRGDRLPWFRFADVHADAALRARPDDPEALTWAAAIKGRLAIDTPSNREKATLGQEVWDLTGRLLEADSSHAFGNDIRGKLNQEVRRLNSFARFLARIFVGNEPLKRSTWEAAETHLLRAIESDPTVVLFYLDLGETYFLQEKYDEAEAAFEAGLGVPEIYPPDGVYKDRMRQLLDDLRSRGA